VVRDKEVDIRGTGWYIRSGKPQRYYGSVFVNTGDNAIDEPVVDCDFDSPDDNNPSARQNTFRDFAVLQHGDAPGIRLRNYVFNTVADCGVDCGGIGSKGIAFEGNAWFTRMLRCQVSAATDICVHVTGGGYAHEFYSNHVRTHEGSARACLQTECNRTIVVGGEYASRGGTINDLPAEEIPPAIRFTTDSRRWGGLVLEPGLEHQSRIEIDGPGLWEDVQLCHLLLPTHDHEDPDYPTVTFGNTRNSKVIYPVVQRARGNLVKWTEQARHCGIITDAESLRNVEYVDEGSTNPYVSVQGSATTDQLADMPTGVPTTVEYATEQGVPVVHDGLSWKRPQAYDSFDVQAE
jgi:hypothetical protein